MFLRNPFIKGVLSGMGLGIIYTYVILVNFVNNPIAKIELISARFYIPIVFLSFALFGLATAEVVINEQEERSS